MMTVNSKQPFSMHHALQEPKYSLHSSSEAMRRVCLPNPQLQGNIFGGFDESLLARAEALAAVDIVSHGKSHPFKPDVTYHTMSSVSCASTSSTVPISHPSTLTSHPHHHLHQSLEGDLLDHISPSLTGMGAPDPSVMSAQVHQHHLQTMGHLHQTMGMGHHHSISSHNGMTCMNDVESDPRELEAFAERFKQRRIKLGVTQADVGSALANLKIPGVGSLSQSTICRFESLTLSHNNMIALKPVLQAWLEEAEAAYREKNNKPDPFNGSERKRKRTSIAAPEKRSLEAYFAIQPRPSSEKIAAIAEKLDLKKNLQGNIFGGFDESLLARAEALAAVDIVSHGKCHPFKPDVTYHTMSSVSCASTSSTVPISHPSTLTSHPHHHLHQSLEGDLLDHISPSLTGIGSPDPSVMSAQVHQHHLQTMGHLHQAMGMGHHHSISSHNGMTCMNDVESDPRELEAFAERFKQRRIKLGVTQADVGSALANLKIPGVGSLSQSTICRFESLTLSHNNMIALKPVLQAWLEEAEAAYREKNNKPDPFNGSERKRKRTSIAAPEKRSLEAYFAIQPRPSSEKIAAIAEKLDLKKNVLQGNIFGGFDESLLARAEALAAVDIVSHGKSHPFKPDVTYHTMSSVSCASTSSTVPISHPSTLTSHPHHHLHQSLEGDLLDHISPSLTGIGSPDPSVMSAQVHQHHLQTMGHLHQAMGMGHHHSISSHNGMTCMNDVESDPRELEAFAERFKQRRIKLGVTQADVGSALANLKIPGVGSLSQSTICRFESLTLSHNNMIALKPVLQAWLEEAEAAYREKNNKPDPFNGSERKRKRTSIAAPEKRSLEAYFAIQPRPSSEKIAAIAEKLDLKKNVVRVWFCNQRQKQKRMKYSAVH
ncbi:UNVERIFIED_CONTAM: hypothetical protein FKN15_065665 [Acipenser sinensis]